jgi:hypothetical protein
MKLSSSKLATLPAVLALTLGITAASTSGSAPAVDYSFREPPLNALGIKSLAELRGKPVVIDFWGKN